MPSSSKAPSPIEDFMLGWIKIGFSTTIARLITDT
jgi:hypothetical protein